MGPLFSVGILGLLMCAVLAGAFVVSRMFGLSLRASGVAAAAFLIGAIGGGIGAVLLMGLFIGFGGELRSSLAAIGYIAALGLGIVLGGSIAVGIARRVMEKSRVPSA